MCAFSRGKTSRVMAPLVNTRHPTVDWGVNLPSKYISMYRTHVCTTLNCQVTFGHANATTNTLITPQQLNWFQTNLEVLGTVPHFELFLFVFSLPPIPAPPLISTLLLFADSLNSMSPAVFDFLDAIEPRPSVSQVSKKSPLVSDPRNC